MKINYKDDVEHHCLDVKARNTDHELEFGNKQFFPMHLHLLHDTILFKTSIRAATPSTELGYSATW